jgi:hypothetical protein
MHGRRKPTVRRKNDWTYKERRGCYGHRVGQKGMDDRSMRLWTARLGQERKENARYDLRKRVNSKYLGMTGV